MKQVSDLLQLNELRTKTVKVIYNGISNTYTLIDKDQTTIGQFDCNAEICVIRGYGYFMHFTEDQLFKLLKGKSDKIRVVGGRRAIRDSEKKVRKNDGLSPFIIR